MISEGCAGSGFSALAMNSGSTSIGGEGRGFRLESWVILGSSTHSSRMLAIDGRALMLAVEEAVELAAEALRVLTMRGGMLKTTAMLNNTFTS